ncbi:MAG: stage 0 sporulation protein [Lachnospiraceae bacterium]|nr:stage 0 sporulation protein [Lachnospiraceae bacterium]
MVKVICVRFRTAGKVYYFDPLSLEIKRGDHVIVETARGIEFGTVVSGVREVEDSEVVSPLKPVLRIATEKDKEQEKTNRQKEKEAFKVCLEKIRKHELDMKLIDAEYTFDNSKILFYFTADGRIDFRELVKDLAAVFKTRIELRQIGVRDETKIIGGYGICGRPLCCHSYLSDFAPVSIRMAKEQNLSLNPTKISGVCGRLMCCLKNEEETYEELNRNLPGLGDTVTMQDGTEGEVSSVNVLRQLVKVLVEVNDEKELREYKADEIVSARKKNKGKKKESAEEAREMQELEKLERMDKSERDEKDERPARKGGQNKGNRPDRKQNNSGQNNGSQNNGGQNNGSQHRNNGANQNGQNGKNAQGEKPAGEEGKSQNQGRRRNHGHRGNRPKKAEGNKQE